MKKCIIFVVLACFLLSSCHDVVREAAAPRRIMEHVDMRVFQDVRTDSDLELSDAELLRELSASTNINFSAADFDEIEYFSYDNFLPGLDAWADCFCSEDEKLNISSRSIVIPRRLIALCNKNSTQESYIVNLNRRARNRILLHTKGKQVDSSILYKYSETMLSIMDEVLSEDLCVDEYSYLVDSTLLAHENSIIYQEVCKYFTGYPGTEQNLYNDLRQNINHQAVKFRYIAKRDLGIDLLDAIDLTTFTIDLKNTFVWMPRTETTIYFPYILTTDYTNWIDTAQWTLYRPYSLLYNTASTSIALSVAKYLSYENFIGDIAGYPFNGPSYRSDNHMDSLALHIDRIQGLISHSRVPAIFSSYYQNLSDGLKAFLLLRRYLGNHVRLITHPRRAHVASCLQANHVVIAIKDHEAVIIHGLTHILGEDHYTIDNNNIETFNESELLLTIGQYILIVYEE